MRPFNVVRPERLEEVPALLQEHGNEAAILAGGTDLLVDLRFGNQEVRPRYLISLGCLAEDLSYVTAGSEGELRIGAMTRLRDIEQSPLVRANWPALASGAGSVGSVQIRNLGTIGGNICRASPAADTVPALVVLGASVVLYGGSGTRTMPIESFFIGPGKTKRTNDEVLVGVVVPRLDPQPASVYLKLGLRAAMEIAIVGVAVSAQKDEAGCWANVKIALGAVGPTVIRARKAESLIAGRQPSKDLHEAVAELAAEECSPRSRVAYKRAMVKVHVRRALEILDRELVGTGGER